MLKAMITSVQRFCLHDGPGVRTTVFFQGCPLRCAWCANPETQERTTRLMHNPLRCIGCYGCIKACSRNALGVSEKGIEIDRVLCNSCANCVQICPTQAMHLSGWEIGVDELMEWLIKDEKYYHKSGGGVTLSGGEATMQPNFCLTLLKKLHTRGIHATLESCGECAEETFEKIASLCDMVLFDVKHVNPQKHMEGCGMDNTLILRNLEAAVRLADTVIRVPLIPGFNDDKDNLLKTAQLASRVGVRKIELLPFHRLGAQKYVECGRVYAYADKPPVEPTSAWVLARKVEEETGVRILVG